MIRRARLSFKPNVRPGGRSAGPGARDGGSQPEEPVQAGEVTAGPEEKSMGGEIPAQRSPDIPEKAAATSSENEPSKPAAAPLQRRKRISTLPNIAKPRVSTSAPINPSQKPQQVESPSSLPVSSVPSKDEVSPPEKVKLPNSPQGSNTASQGQHVTLPEKRTPIPQVPQFSPFKKASLKHPDLSPLKNVDFTQKEEFSPLKERPSQKSSPNECKMSTPKMLVASGNLEKVRLRRAQKLRDLLKDELKKERKEWKAKHPVISNIGELERSKMVMRDFIYFIPESNPMKSSFAETKSSEKAPTESQLSGTPVKNISNDEDDDMDEEEDDSQLLAPRVKVAEDGSIILDEESLTVEVSRGKAPIVEGNDPIFERGSTTTYSSFRKSNYSKPWSEEETDMFFLAISMVGTDFSMIGQLFPHRERIEIKNKFKREERANSWRIDKAFKEKKAFDLVFFSKRLERALEAAKKKRTAPKVRQPREKKATKPRKKAKDKAAAEHVLSDEEMVKLSDGEGADTRTEEKENEGSASVKECLLPSDNVPGKKRRNRKKKDTKEPEEETHESSPEGTTTLPKKPRKKRAAEQVKDSELAVKDKNLEDVQEAPDAVREKKKKSRKKKSTNKEVEPEDTGDGDIIDVPSPQRDAVDEKSAGSALPDDADSLMCMESGEPTFTQSEVLTCAEESSLILFTEESECFSEPDDISSLQESLSVIPGSQTLADQTGSFDNVPVEISQEDSVFETSCHLTSDSPKEAPLEEDMAKDSRTGTEVKESTESQKESLSKPADLTRSRFQRPRPNLPTRTLPRQEKVLVSERDDITEERNDLPADDSSSQSHQKDKSITENLEIEESEFSITGSPTKDDIPCPIQTISSLESPQLQLENSDIVPPECAAAKEDIKQEKPLPIRGRLVRPKPNLKKAPVKDKPHSPDLRSPPNSDSQDSGEIAMVPCTVVLAPLSNNEEDTLTKEKAESSTSSQEQSTKSTIKPAPLVRGRPKPNTTKTSRKEKYEAMEGSEKCDKVSSEDATGVMGSKASCSQNDAVLENHEGQEDLSKHKDTCLDFDTIQDSGIPIKALSTPLSPVQEVIPEPDPALSSVSESEAESKTSPINLPQGQLQTLKPNVLKSCDHKGISGMRLEENTDITPEDTGQDVKGKRDDLSDLEKPTDFRKEASSSDESCGHQENHMKPTEMDQVLPRDPKPEVDPKVSEVHQPAKPAVLTRGRLQRPKPNIVRALPRRGALTSSDNSRNKSEVEAGEKASESSQPATSYESEKAPNLAKTATEDMPSPVEIAHSNVLSLETIGLPGADQIENKESPSVSVDDSAPVGMKKELSGSEEEKKAAPTKPTLTRSRLLRPKPNLSSSVTRTSVSAPQKCVVHEEGKSGKDDVNTSSMENLSQCDAGKIPVLANTETEDTDSPEEITQSYILPLETIVPGVDEMDSEESSAVPMDNSPHVTIKNHLSTSEDERMVEPSPGLTRSRLQRPKPNLSRSVTRPALSTPQKCDVHEERKTTSDSFDTSPIEKKTGISEDKQNVDLSQDSCPAEGYDIKLDTEEVHGGSLEGFVQLEHSSCTGEQMKEPSVKPLRSRFQKPKPNLGRASVRKESGAFASEQKEGSFDSTSKRPEHLEKKEASGLLFTNDAASGNRAESTQHTTIKPALLRRSRLVRPVPSYGKPSNKRPSALQSKTVDEGETSTDTDLEASSNKRKASECFPDVSPKRSCIPDTSQNSSDSALDQVPSTSALPDSSQSNDMLEDNKQQHSRFGRLLKRPVSTTPPVLTKPSENVTERPEKKTSKNNKSVKSTVAKPASSKGKTTLVKIRAMKQDEDDDDDELEYEDEDEDYDVAPDKLNQAPVFVPFSLRSPKPIPAEIEETVEEFEIPLEDLGVPISTAQNLRSPCLTQQDVSQHVPVSQADPGHKGPCDGSTEAAMTLISIGNSVFQSKLGEPLDSDQYTGSQLSLNADCKPEASTLSVQVVCATEDDTTINARPVKICQNTPGLQVGNEALSANEQSSDPVITDLHTSEQPSHLLNVNVTLPLEQMSYPIIQDDLQQKDCSTSDNLLEGAAGEETFILTLVEIPISEGYSYSCDGNSVDVLPAPVFITSGSSQVVTPDQRTAALSEPSSSVSCPPGQGEAKLELSLPSRKRSASMSSESDKSQPCIKALRCASAEQGEDHTTNNTAAFEENETRSMPAEIKTEEPHPSSMDIALSSPEGEKVPECTVDSSTRFGTVAHIENPASTSYDSPSRVLPSSSSSSSRIQQRPGRKPLGFLSLVCKEKQSKKTKVSSKKNPSKPKSKKAKVDPEEQNPTRIHENAPSNEVPCQSSSSAVTSTLANTETIPCTSQVSENLDTITQESPKSQELATEDDAATVSEYFFSDIFMEVDE